MLFEEAFEEFKIYARNRHKKQGFYSLSHYFSNNVLPFFKGRTIESLTKQDVLYWQNEILSRNYSNSYNNNLYWCFASFMDFYCISYDLKENLVRSIGNFPRKNETRSGDYYTLKEFKKFIKHVDGIIYKRFFETMFWCGSRPGETMAFRFSDLNKYFLEVNHNLERHFDRELTTPKNKTSNRKIYITKCLYRRLLKLKKLYVKIHGDVDYDYFIFGGLKPLSPTSIDRYKLKACQKARIKVIRQHDFRHSHATFLCSRGIAPNIIKRRLGHSKLSTTLDIYVHDDLNQEKRVLSHSFF